jgi:hypothetical protein
MPFQEFDQPEDRKVPVLVLGTRIRDRDRQPGRDVPQSHRGRYLIYILTARPPGPGERFFELRLVKPECAKPR